MPASTESDADQTLAWMSGSNVIHLSLECPGLDRMREFGRDPRDHFEPLSYASPVDLLEHRAGGTQATLCRLCAVEPVAAEVLRTYPLPAGEAGVFATFTLARPAPVRRKKSQYTEDPDRDRKLAEDASERLSRIARAADLQVTRAHHRPAAFGFMSPDAIRVLSRVVVIEPKYTVTQMPSAEMVSTFWSLRANNSAPGSAPADASADAPADPWYVAELIWTGPSSDTT